MIGAAFDRQLLETFGSARVGRLVPLAPMTTFKVGGPADWLIDLHDAADLRDVLSIAAAHAIPVVVLGGGSNVLVSDAGIRGLVVRLRGGQVARVADDRIRADAGLTINGLVRWTLTHGLASLEAWAGTPGTVGGAIHGNAHFRGRLIGELVTAATLVTRDGRVEEVQASALEFGYDYSRLQRTREIVVSADFIVRPGDPASLRVASSWHSSERSHWRVEAQAISALTRRDLVLTAFRIRPGRSSIAWIEGALEEQAPFSLLATSSSTRRREADGIRHSWSAARTAFGKLSVWSCARKSSPGIRLNLIGVVAKARGSRRAAPVGPCGGRRRTRHAAVGRLPTDEECATNVPESAT
jgi:UDP-N-acetylenolpyruvoylglucosamine reductase